jgi:hypothetical protein
MSCVSALLFALVRMNVHLFFVGVFLVEHLLVGFQSLLSEKKPTRINSNNSRAHQIFKCIKQLEGPITPPTRFEKKKGRRIHIIKPERRSNREKKLLLVVVTSCSYCTVQ